MSFFYSGGSDSDGDGGDGDVVPSSGVLDDTDRFYVKKVDCKWSIEDFVRRKREGTDSRYGYVSADIRLPQGGKETVAFYLFAEWNSQEETGHNPSDYVTFHLKLVGYVTEPVQLWYDLCVERRDGTLLSLPDDHCGHRTGKMFVLLDDGRDLISSYLHKGQMRDSRAHQVMPGGTLTLVARLKILCPCPQSTEQWPRSDTLGERMWRLREESWDVQLRCRDKTFPACKTVLTASSSVFKAMFGHDTLESRTNTVEITDIDPHIFGQFLRYLYLEDCFPSVWRSPAKTVALMKVADKYNVTGLKARCQEELCHHLGLHNVGTLGQTALQFCAEESSHEFQRDLFLSSMTKSSSKKPYIKSMAS